MTPLQIQKKLNSIGCVLPRPTMFVADNTFWNVLTGGENTDDTNVAGFLYGTDVNIDIDDNWGVVSEGTEWFNFNKVGDDDITCLIKFKNLEIKILNQVTSLAVGYTLKSKREESFIDIPDFTNEILSVGPYNVFMAYIRLATGTLDTYQQFIEKLFNLGSLVESCVSDSSGKKSFDSARDTNEVGSGLESVSMESLVIGKDGDELDGNGEDESGDSFDYFKTTETD